MTQTIKLEDLHKVSSERETHGLMAHSVRASEWNSVVVGSKFHSGQLSIATYTSKNPSVVNTIIPNIYIYIYIYLYIYICIYIIYIYINIYIYIPYIIPYIYYIYVLYFTIKGIFVLKIFKLFLRWLFAHAKKRLY